MTKTCIIGAGKRAQRLQKRLPAYGFENINLMDSFQKTIDVSSYEKVIICVPTYCVGEVLGKVQRDDKKKTIISCVKGLINNGESVCAYLDEHFQNHMEGSSYFLGGANIDDGNEIIEITRDRKLELACILKNVYAIGFGIALKQGENYAMHELIKYLREYGTLGIKDNYRADLLVSCYSDKSRNKTFGRTFAQGERYDEKTVEGLYTAQVIEKHNLFKSCPELRKITKTIIEQ